MEIDRRPCQRVRAQVPTTTKPTHFAVHACFATPLVWNRVLTQMGVQFVERRATKSLTLTQAILQMKRRKNQALNIFQLQVHQTVHHQILQFQGGAWKLHQKKNPPLPAFRPAVAIAPLLAFRPTVAVLAWVNHEG